MNDINQQNDSCKENKYFTKKVEDARLLLDYAISSGSARPDGITIPDDVINAINSAEKQMKQAMISKFAPPEIESQFDAAFQKLSAILTPVTADTLRATSDQYGRKPRLISLKTISEATIWSRKLTVWTVTFVLAALIGEAFKEIQSQYFSSIDEAGEGETNKYLISFLFEYLTPFAYGGIGACAYLLRQAHQYIHKREFDINRIPEYYSRILLGLISGGTITLFISQIDAGGGEVIHLSANALGFLAGYNSDLLFQTIERITQAILPKVDITTMRRASPRAIPSPKPSIDGLSLKDLLDRYNGPNLSEGDRALYRSLIEKYKELL